MHPTLSSLGSMQCFIAYVFCSVILLIVTAACYAHGGLEANSCCGPSDCDYNDVGGGQPFTSLTTPNGICTQRCNNVKSSMGVNNNNKDCVYSYLYNVTSNYSIYLPVDNSSLLTACDVVHMDLNARDRRGTVIVVLVNMLNAFFTASNFHGKWLHRRGRQSYVKYTTLVSFVLCGGYVMLIWWDISSLVYVYGPHIASYPATNLFETCKHSETTSLNVVVQLQGGDGMYTVLVFFHIFLCVSLMVLFGMMARCKRKEDSEESAAVENNSSVEMITPNSKQAIEHTEEKDEIPRVSVEPIRSTISALKNKSRFLFNRDPKYESVNNQIVEEE
eukprot:PhF_6_TR6981/c0_g1_i1/m.10325